MVIDIATTIEEINFGTYLGDADITVRFDVDGNECVFDSFRVDSINGAQSYSHNDEQIVIRAGERHVDAEIERLQTAAWEEYYQACHPWAEY